MYHFFTSFSVKIHDLTEMKEIYAIITLEDAGGLELITIFFLL